MPSLSTPIGELRSRYGVVVVGSGYGASVAAYRMATLAAELATAGRPTFSVCVLERGLEIPTGDYPSTLSQVTRQMQVDTSAGHIGAPTALFDLRLNRDISALLGCGLGGGSLINAGVMLAPQSEVFEDPRWPAAIRNDGLDTYFDEVRGELGVAPVPKDVDLLKVTRLFESVQGSPDPETRSRPRVAVSFRTEINRRGIQQKACVLCGDCMTGCNHSAKNTLVMNYLPAAATAGAAIFCRMDVQAIERRDDRWLVHLRVLDRAFRTFGSPELTIQADAVFLGAGTLGSVEILLRSQRRGLTLSPRLGEQFSGNGDVIAFAYNATEPVNGFGYGTYVPPDAAVGPLIAGMVDERAFPRGAMLQEGTIPGALIPLLRFAAPVMARVSDRPIDLSGTLRFSPVRRELDSFLRGARHGALRRTQTFLGMGYDDARGVMRLSHDRLRIRWPWRMDDTVIKDITRRMGALTRGMKGRYLVNPFWSSVFGRRRVTVHPLGGACMAEGAEQGVVDADGRVFADASGNRVHDGLYVCDGAVVPMALGANPALTIAALAERIAQRAAAPVQRLTTATAGRHQPPRVRPSVPGIHYAERLQGRLSFGTSHSRFKLVLHISAENLQFLISDPNHTARVVGVLSAPGLPAGRRQFAVSEGTFKVLVDDETQVDSKLVHYRFKLTAADGSEFWWSGQKEINHQTAKKGLWRVVSSYSFVVTTGDTADVVGEGVARSSVLDAIRMVTSMRITHERSWLDRQLFKAAYRGFFARGLRSVLARSLVNASRVNPFADASKALPSDDLEQGPTVEDKKRSGRPRFWLTPYRKKGLISPKGAVILAPGFGMSSHAFLLNNSLTEHLCKEGYVVWLLDYRASDRLAASLEQFTLDDLAIGEGPLAGDFPDAVEEVFLANNRQPVQIIAHCVASLSVFMALLAGTLTRERVRSVILSQSFACIDHPWINRFKAWIRLPQFLRWMRFMTVMTPDYDLRSGWRSHLLDRLLRLYPTNERCSSGVCRRLLLMYGEVIRHDQLDKRTHDLLHHLFDRANLTTFVHLSLMISRGRIVDKHGRDKYWTQENIKRIDVPITLLQGMGNRLFRPRGAIRTLRGLRTHGRDPKLFALESVPGHGHLDTFIGKNAPAEVYPRLSRLLEAGAGTAPDGQPA